MLYATSSCVVTGGVKAVDMFAALSAASDVLDVDDGRLDVRVCCNV